MNTSGSSAERTERILEVIGRLLGKTQGECESGYQLKPISGDGSIRRFWRIENGQGNAFVAVAPPKGGGERDWAEASASWKIGSHLRAAGIAVPEIFGFDEDRKLLIYEDLGNRHLHALIVGLDLQDDDDLEIARSYYHKAVDQLILLQFEGARDFCTDWCWDTPRYDRKLMLERESGYFLSAFWQGWLEREVPDGLLDEFRLLADQAAAIDAGYFLHRDFQSRNIMVKDGAVRIIDYQGGRLGPLGYDLASLLIDPYVALPIQLQSELFDYYYVKLSLRLELAREEFKRQFLLLALQRNLQIIGAFAFLSRVRGKLFFQDYIEPAARSLTRLLAELQAVEGTVRLGVLRKVAQESVEILGKKDFNRHPGRMTGNVHPPG